MPKLIAVNEQGLRIGEDHPNAGITNQEVEAVRQLHEDGMRYEDIAAKFELSKWAVGRICRYERRGQTVARWKTVSESPTPTTIKANQKRADTNSLYSANQQAAKNGPSGTMLTGSNGIDPSALQLGKSTLLGG